MREDKVCLPSLSKSFDKACNQTGILLNKDNDSFCTVSRSTYKLGGSRRPQSPTVNCLSEESDIASYFVDISLMFASLIQLKITIFLRANDKSKFV